MWNHLCFSLSNLWDDPAGSLLLFVMALLCFGALYVAATHGYKRLKEQTRKTAIRRLEAWLTMTGSRP